MGEPPLAPSPDDARGALRRELVDPQYYDQDLLQRILGWLQRLIDGTVEGASSLPALTWLAVTAIVVGLAITLGLLLSRARRTARRSDDRGAVLTREVVSSAELRSRAERALTEARFGDAVVDGFRAVAVAQVERGRLDDAPGSTAHEVAVALVTQYPTESRAVDAAARHFDAVLYGDRPAARAEAEAVLALDARLRSPR
ncbi:DUF4129 domain-containing protein [Nocardioides sp.]|uniref:DUF4129 domain-containing protein n=1 Tax=Nocardioides sp. TaxID=35761 RepID=UPI002B27B296|nr:DUF4129 domain-containing protein [Nocardioides sp.]